MSDRLDHVLDPLPLEPFRRLCRAAAGNASSPDGVTLVQATRCDLPVAAVLTVTISWATDVETRAGHQLVKAAIFCRNAAELDATLARDLDAEAASVETAHRLATAVGAPEAPRTDFDALPGLASMRGPYYVHEACRSCSGGGVRACTNPVCRGGKTGDDPCDCPVCGGAGVVPCDDCAGVGRFTHIHRPRLVARATRGFDLPPDAPAAVRPLLEAVGFDRFAEVAQAGTATLRYSGPQLFYERAGTVPVVTLSCTCDGVAFELEAVGPEGAMPELPCFLDQVLAPVLERIRAASSADAFAVAAMTRVTAAVADAVLAGGEPDLDAIVADNEDCVSRAFVAQVATALRRAHRAAGIGTARRVWQYAAAAMGGLLLLVAAIDVPALLTGATAEEPAPLPLRAFWDLGVPVAAGLGVWLLARYCVRRTMRAALGGGTVHPTAQGAWPALVLGAAAVLHLGVMVVMHGGLAVNRSGDPLELSGTGITELALPPPRVLSPAERIAAAQRALARLGRYDGPIDGKLGDGTKTGIASLAELVGEVEAAGGPLGLAVDIATDRVPIRLSTPDRLVGPGWSNATRLRLTADDQPRIAQAFLGAVAAFGTPREWTSGDGTRSGIVMVSGRAEDPKGRQRLCLAFTHAVTTPAGRDAGVPAKACRSGGHWLIEE